MKIIEIIVSAFLLIFSDKIQSRSTGPKEYLTKQKQREWLH